MRSNFFTIVLSILLSLTLASCNSSRRAARRIQRIAENHPELLVADTIRIDTFFIYNAPADTVVIEIDSVQDDSVPVIMHTEHGYFSITRLHQRRIEVIYTPDTAKIQYRDEIPVQTVVIEYEPRWKRNVRYIVLIFVGVLLVCKLRNDLKKILKT